MAPTRKRVWKRDESAKEARRAKKDSKNENNAKANAKARIEESAESKFEREKARIPHAQEFPMSKKVEFCPLVKVMERGFLNDLRMFCMKDHKFFVPILMDSSNSFVQHIKQGLQDSFEPIKGDTQEEAKVERVQNYFEGNTSFIHVFISLLNYVFLFRVMQCI